jgi:CheY-like chemotaxis protein
MVIVCTSLTGLALACLSFDTFEKRRFRDSMTSELSVLADTLGANTGASLTFKDRKSAEDMLAGLQAESHIIGACLYDSHGEAFAKYLRKGIVNEFAMPVWQQDEAVFRQDSLTLFRSVSLGGEKIRVAAYLLKPIRQSELREAVALVLGAREREGAIPLITRFSVQDAREPGAFLSVLLAEDNLVNQRLAVRLLEKKGHRVVVAATGLGALKALEKESFDLVIMDVQMPEMDGIEATGVIRKNEKISGVHQPIVALTAHAIKGDREKCLAAGMDGYLTKPIRPQELDHLLELYVARRLEARSLAETLMQKK